MLSYGHTRDAEPEFAGEITENEIVKAFQLGVTDAIHQQDLETSDTI